MNKFAESHSDEDEMAVDPKDKSIRGSAPKDTCNGLKLEMTPFDKKVC